MKFGEAISSGFSNYVTFTGRASRSEYWYWTLFVTLASIVLQILDIALGALVLNSIFSLATLLPGIAVAVRRLHDVNKSGWWLLLVFTVIGIFVILYWMIKKSDYGENNYAYND